ncbi:MAG: IS21 family transposase [Chloroflexi bacterium]|nr:MAG: IS21 family transposase [Chloroflexota bacterium]
MDEKLRNEIVQRWQAKTPQRQIARALGVARTTVQHVIYRFERERSGQAPASPLPRPSRRPSSLDEHDAFIGKLLERYPNMTAVRVHEELRTRGFRGSYTMVRLRVQALRPQPTREPVVRFETSPGVQAQMDYSTYDLDFSEEGRRRVYLFSYVLSYSRRAYMRFVEAQDFTTTIREHVRAFAYLQGVAAVCVYDNMKVVVLRHDEDGPLYNPRFLAFATHYGFKPWACLPRRARTKGRVERKFDFVQKNLLNGRSFCNLAHLNEVSAWWLAQVADLRVHRETKQRPIDRYALERPHLVPLPAQPYDTAQVLYRIADVEGFVCYQQNYYSVPWRFIGQSLPLRITEKEVIIYSPAVAESARHRLFPRGTSQQRSVDRAHRPRDNAPEHLTLLRERFSELGTSARRFLDGVLRDQRYGKNQARRVLALLGTYARKDLLAALERAVRFGAYSAPAVERILAAQAKPKSVLEALADDDRRRLQPLLDEPVSPRSTAEYQQLCEDPNDHGQANEAKEAGSDDERRPDPDESAGLA